jgi:hypothetical protein
MASPRFSIPCFLIFALVSCGPTAHRDPTVGEAYIGPATVRLRKEITPKSDTAATAHFGEKVGIVATKRRFVRVRTRDGTEGWIDDNMLLAQSDMDQIKTQSDAARHYPSQGVATFIYEITNVRAQPNRFSPSYIQIREGEKFDVLEHRVVAVPPSAIRKPLVSSPKPAKKSKKESKSRVPPPPAPAPPPLPADWIDLSKAGEDAASLKSDDPPPATPEEDWSLIRTASGQSGWVLSRRVYMAIPDEVAQYAEGHRITSYFSLGKTQDGDRVKDIWLWTTIRSSSESYDFDGFRVFTWSLRHHRYETALIQRRIQGYFPTLVDKASGSFSVCIDRDDGTRYRREYRLVDKQVKLVGEKPCEAWRGDKAPAGNPSDPVASSQGAFEKLKGKIKSIVK